MVTSKFSGSNMAGCKFHIVSYTSVVSYIYIIYIYIYRSQSLKVR